MIGVCAICSQILIGRPVAMVGRERPAAELAALAAVTRDHLAAQHPEMVAAFNVVLQPAIDHLALRALDPLEAEDRAVMDALLDTACEVIRSAALVRRPAWLEPDGGPVAA